jgi:sulfate permease, SulP family
MTSLQQPSKPAPGVKRAWPVLRSFAGYRASFIPADLIAGLTLAAIAIPSQMATARLAGFPPQFGFFALIAGSVAFAIFGNSRLLSCAADSTIAPIFAGALAAFVAAGTPEYAGSAAVLALMVGALVTLAGLFRLGRIADLLSLPVTTGFFLGIAIHISVAQLPSLLGLDTPSGTIPQQLSLLARHFGEIHYTELAIGSGVFALICMCSAISKRVPGALIGLTIATLAVIYFDLTKQGVAVLGTIDTTMPAPHVPMVDLADLTKLGSLSFIVALVVMVQTAATTRSSPASPDNPADIPHDFVGVGAGSILAGLFGAFPVNASPPNTTILGETGGRSQLAGLFVAAIVVGLLAFGSGLLRNIPHAALAGVLVFVAMRLVKLRLIIMIFRQSFPEFLLIVATAAAIAALPIEEGAAVGIILSLLQGVWRTSRARVVFFEPLPDTSIWWPVKRGQPVRHQPGILVIGFEAPLSFLNADHFRRDIKAAIRDTEHRTRLVVLEGSGIIEVDFTAAQTLRELIAESRESGIAVAFARIESPAAQEALLRFGVADLLGGDHIFHSVDEAVRTMESR